MYLSEKIIGFFVRVATFGKKYLEELGNYVAT